MNENMLSNNFTENINVNMIKRNIQLLRTVMLLFCSYTVLNFIDWYVVISQANPVRHTAYALYLYKIRPIIVVIDAAIIYFIWSNYIQGHKLILLSFENDNPDFFNKGYSLLCRAVTLNIAGYILIILSLTFRFILKYLP
jgi:hypothetical protein